MTGVKMSSVNISSMYIPSDIAIAEYIQVELRKLDTRTTNNVSLLKHLARLPRWLSLKCE